MTAPRFRSSQSSIRAVGATLLALAAFASARPASAYRPFDGTAAAVADAGTFELELGPAQLYRLGGARYLVAPAVVLNFGIAPKFELVVEGKQFVASHAPSYEPRVRLLDTSLLLKHVLRPGALQGEPGLSVALEAGAELPEVRAEPRFGAQANLIESQRGRLGALHLNQAAELSRTGHWVLVGSVLIEAPETWGIRPVAEFAAEHEFGADSAYSALLGAIWPAAESLDVDSALRVGRQNGVRVVEVRFGFSWALPLADPSYAAR